MNIKNNQQNNTQSPQQNPPLNNPHNLSLKTTCCQGFSVVLQVSNLFLIFSVIYPTLPVLAEKRDISATIVGLIQSVWSIPSFFLIFFVASIQKKYGSKNFFIFNIIVLNIFAILMGLLQHIQNRAFFIFWAFFTRIIQGSIGAFVKNMYYTLSARLYPNQASDIYAWIYTILVLSLGIGPLYGGALGESVDFQTTLYFTGGLGFLLFLPMAIKYFPNWLNQFNLNANTARMFKQKKGRREGQLEQEQQQHNQIQNGQMDRSKEYAEENSVTNLEKGAHSRVNSQVNQVKPLNKQCQQQLQSPTTTTQPQKKKKPNFCQVFCRLKVIAILLSMFNSVFTQIYFTPFLTLHLIDEYNISQSLHGLFYIARAISAILFTNIIIKLVEPCCRKQILMIVGNILCILSYIFFGTSELFGIPQNVGFIWAGIILNGAISGWIFAPGMPILIDYYKRHEFQLIKNPKQQQQYQNQFVHNLATASNFVMGAAQVVSPLLGGLFYDLVGYRGAFNIATLIVTLITIFFLVFGGVIDKKQTRYFNERKKKCRVQSEKS